jgi:preprotein translocase subunit SecA
MTATFLSPPRLEMRIEPLRDVPARYRKMLRKVRDLEASLTGLDDARLRTYLAKSRRGIRQGESTDKHLPMVFAITCVAARRSLGMRPYNVQLIGGYELHRGAIAEMGTGEGKTLVATLPAVLNAINGKGVHIVTVNDYLAQRDAQVMGPLYEMVGLSVGVIISGLSDDQRRTAYRADILYGTNKEIGFDYLRDQIKQHARGTHHPIDTMALLNRGGGSQDPVQRRLHYAIVDEADSILIDESRTPLIIAGPSRPSELGWAYEWSDRLAQRFRLRHDFEIKPEKRQLTWTDSGRARLEKVLRETSTPSVSGESWQNLILNALRARWLFAKDKHYVVNGQDVVIVDEYTGRRMPGRTWSDGLHQAVQAKEKLPIMTEAGTLARTTYQHFFSLYDKLGGMTGTAWTENVEFKKVYELPVVRIPPHRPIQRRLLPDRIYRTRREKWLGVAAEIEQVTKTGRPVLVGTASIEDSEELAAVLEERHIAHEVLNARPENAHREAEIVAAAGQLHAVTIATNMAGRGTDIKLGPGVGTLGGLHVIGTQRHESRRIDNQLVGRCGRQGDPGSCIFILSLQDALLEQMLDRKKIASLRRKIALTYGHATEARPIRALFRSAQSKVERMHQRMRAQLMEYEDWLNKVYHQMGT